MASNSNILDELYDWFWKDEFWLPRGISFRDLQDKPGYHYAKPRDLYMMLLFALIIFCCRKIFETFVANPLARKWKIPGKRKQAEENPILERAFKEEKTPSNDRMMKISKALKWSEKRVFNWFRRRRNMHRPTLSKKFSEASWRCFFYAFVFTFGMSLLVQAPWFWDNIQCWTNYPRQSLWTSVYLYYMLEGGFYISLLFSVMKDVKRKDFLEQLIHHVATIFLIIFSYVANFVRVGTLVMAIHDVSDIFLEFGKCFVYAKRQAIADNVFVIFAIVFIISRIFVYPYVVIHTTWVKSMWLYEPYPGYYLFNALLMILQLLHIFWAATIIHMAIKMHTSGTVEKDERSDVEEETSEDGELPNGSAQKKKQ